MSGRRNKSHHDSTDRARATRLTSTAGALGVIAAAAVLTACTKAPVPATTITSSAAVLSSSVAAPASTDPAPASTSVPVTSTSPTLTTPASSTSASSSAATPTSSAPATSSAATSSDRCTGSDVTVTVERGSGVAGHQYATLVFVNSSAAACTMTGFPTIALLAGNATIGTSKNSGSGTTVVRITPGQSASSDLVNNSTCGADNSDSIRVGIPGTSDTVVKPLSFRGCTVTISAVQAGS